jgi:hypothetical protein
MNISPCSEHLSAIGSAARKAFQMWTEYDGAAKIYYDAAKPLFSMMKIRPAVAAAGLAPVASPLR